jgi:hypothetical protein
MTTQTQIRTVRRSSREALEMWDNATRALVFTLGNGFCGEDAAVDRVRDYYASKAHVLKPSITHNGRAYVICWHSNHWVELLCPA